MGGGRGKSILGIVVRLLWREREAMSMPRIRYGGKPACSAAFAMTLATSFPSTTALHPGIKLAHLMIFAMAAGKMA